MSIRKPKVGHEDISDRFPRVSTANASAIAPLDDHDPEDRYGSFAAHLGGQPLKGGLSSGVIGRPRQRTGPSRSRKPERDGSRRVIRRGPPRG